MHLSPSSMRKSSRLIWLLCVQVCGCIERCCIQKNFYLQYFNLFATLYSKKKIPLQFFSKYLVYNSRSINIINFLTILEKKIFFWKKCKCLSLSLFFSLPIFFYLFLHIVLECYVREITVFFFFLRKVQELLFV